MRLRLPLGPTRHYWSSQPRCRWKIEVDEAVVPWLMPEVTGAVLAGLPLEPAQEQTPGPRELGVESPVAAVVVVLGLAVRPSLLAQGWHEHPCAPALQPTPRQLARQPSGSAGGCPQRVVVVVVPRGRAPS